MSTQCEPEARIRRDILRGLWLQDAGFVIGRHVKIESVRAADDRASRLKLCVTLHADPARKGGNTLSGVGEIRGE
jgi:hypothetical protein